MAKKIKKDPRGRKKLEDKKELVPLYVYESVIKSIGGKAIVQEKCYELIESLNKKK
jgi:hypothetical protein